MIILEDRDLKPIKGTFMKPESILSSKWKKLLEADEVTLVLKENISAAALAMKVWPELSRHISCIVIAGGTLKRGNATPWAEETIYRDPYAVESLLNTGVKVIFALKETSEKHDCSMYELAKNYALSSEKYNIKECGIHVETDENARTYGKLVCDHLSDKKFEKRNSGYIE